MNVIFSTGSPSLRLKNTCAAIGIFDGVHRGHQYLIQKMLAQARRLKAKPIVITFFPHPAHVLRPDIPLQYLSSLADRLHWLDAMGVDTCVIVRFTPAFSRIDPEAFIKNILVKKLGVRAIFVGEDFHFGKDRRGNVALFQDLSRRCGYEIFPVAPLKSAGAVISSTHIRGLVQEGKLSAAQRLLGRPVMISGKVIVGSRRGKQLGYPTANVSYEADVMPPRGVYVVQAVIGPKIYPAMANVGTRPSFKERNPKVHLEVHILDFHKDIYGKEIQVRFLKKIRNEQAFPNLPALIRQIQKDERSTRQYFKHLV